MLDIYFTVREINGGFLISSEGEEFFVKTKARVLKKFKEILNAEEVEEEDPLW